MTKEEAILWMQVLKHSKVNWVGEQDEDEDIIARCEEAEQEAFDMAIEALSADTVPIEKYHELQHQFVMLGATFADLTEVVRCKDCRWWQDNNNGYPHANCHWCETETPDEDDFCSLGERQET